MGKRAAEQIIVVIYSVYALAFMFASTILGWPGWITPITSVGVVTLWIVYLREIRDYRFRSLLYAAVVLATFVLYNTQENSFGGILTTYCAAVVVLSILDIPEIVIPEYVCSVLLIAYHGLIADTIPLATVQEKIRSAVQILCLFAVVIITHHLIKKHEAINRETRQMIEELQRSEQDKRAFLSELAHEFSGPASAMVKAGEELLDGELPHSVEQGLHGIQAAGQGLLRRIGDVQDFAELEAGRAVLTEQPYQLAPIIHDVIGAAMAERGEKELELIVDCDPRLPRVLLGDEQKLRRAMLSLVSNAVKFTQRGCVALVVSARAEQYGVNLCVKVKDTGAGIAQEKLETLFSGFDRADTNGEERRGGIRIGLAIAKGIVSSMNGFISVKSEPGKGSEFQFVIPQKVVDPRPTAEVSGGESMSVLSYINAEKASFTEFRDTYMSAIRHMLEGLELRHHLCRNLDELKRRAERERYTHALITEDEYREDPAYFEKLSEQLRVVLVHSGEASPAVGGAMTAIQKPVSALSLEPALSGDQRPGAGALREGDDRPPAPGKPPVRTRPLIDRDKGIQHMGGSRADYEEVLQVYLDEGREVFEEIEKRYRAEDWKNYVIYVHALKSNSLGIGAEELGELARALEAAGKAGDTAFLQARHGEMMELYGQVLAEIGGDAAGAQGDAGPAEGRARPAEGGERA